MKRLLATAVVTVLTGVALASGAVAQNTGPPANPNASTPAVANPNANNPGAPAAGANSFTEGQAKSRIEAAGYSNISGLTKDKDGIWRGRASRGGATVDGGSTIKVMSSLGNCCSDFHIYQGISDDPNSRRPL